MKVFTLSSLSWTSKLSVDVIPVKFILTHCRVQRLRAKLKEQRKHMDELDKHL